MLTHQRMSNDIGSKALALHRVRMNPNAQGFQPYRLHSGDHITPSREVLRRSSSSTSNASYASQIDPYSSASTHSLASKMSGMFLDDLDDKFDDFTNCRQPEKRLPMQQADTVHTPISAFHTQPGARPNYSLIPSQTFFPQTYQLDQYTHAPRNGTLVSKAMSTSSSSSTSRGLVATTSHRVPHNGASPNSSRMPSWSGSDMSLASSSESLHNNHANSITVSRHLSDANGARFWNPYDRDRRDSVQEEPMSYEQKALSVSH